jgi:hypothetical protein
MSTKQKVLLAVVAVALVVLFVVAVGAGNPGKGNATGHHGFVDWLSRLGGKRAAVPVQLVTAPQCKQPDNTLHVTNSCTLHVADPSSLKLLVLRSTTRFKVTAPGPGRTDFTAEDTVKVGTNGIAEARIAVDKESNIVVSCVDSAACVLSIGEA